MKAVIEKRESFESSEDDKKETAYSQVLLKVERNNLR